jgi:hypothetical protein
MSRRLVYRKHSIKLFLKFRGVKKQKEEVIAFEAGGLSRTLGVVGGMTYLAKCDSYRRPLTIQFGP